MGGMSLVPPDVARFDSREVAPSDGFDAWRGAVNRAFVPLEARHEGGGAYRGGLLSQELGTLAISEVAGESVHVSRGRHQIAAADPGVYKIGLQLHGYCVLAQDGREAALTPGDLAIYDTTRPYELDFADRFGMFVLLVPRGRLGLSPEQVGRVTAERISGRHGLGALTSALLDGLGRQLREGGADPDPRALDAVLEMLSATLAQRLGPERTVPAGQVVFAAATAWIDEHLGDASLEVADVAASQHVSLRYLQRLFSEHGTSVSAWIRRRRLERCRAELSDASLSGRPIAAIAARWGFPDASAFSRAFRAASGVSPSEFRSSLGA